MSERQTRPQPNERTPRRRDPMSLDWLPTHVSLRCYGTSWLARRPHNARNAMIKPRKLLQDDSSVTHNLYISTSHTLAARFGFYPDTDYVLRLGERCWCNNMQQLAILAIQGPEYIYYDSLPATLISIFDGFALTWPLLLTKIWCLLPL